MKAEKRQTARIGLVSPAHLSANPRLVKEADALAESGYPVTALVSDQVPWLSRLDESIETAGKIEVKKLRRLSKLSRVVLRLRQKLFRGLVRVGFALNLQLPGWMLAEALDPACPRLQRSLTKLMRQSRLRLLIGHNLAALPAVATVALRNGVAFAFDVEDSHVDELYPEQKFERRLRQAIESKWLPSAAYVSAASPGIGEAVSRRYGIQTQTILNVFPGLPGVTGAPTPQPGTVRWFWFSQTLGHDRGIETFLAHARELEVASVLTVVGKPLPGYREQLAAEARRCGVALVFHDMVAPDRLYELAAQNDCGLALEHRQPLNKDLCLANKIFTYLAAGIPVLLSPTAAHRQIARDLGDAACLLGDERETDAALGQWIARRLATGDAARAAQACFRSRYNWAVEAQQLLRLVDGALRAPGSPGMAAAGTAP